MRNVIFVAPFFLETTLRFINAVASVPGVRVGLLSQDSEDTLDGGLRGRLSMHLRLEDALDTVQIRDAVQEMASSFGTVDRLLGTLEELQVPLAEVRESLRIPGMGFTAAMNFRDKARMKNVLREAGLPCARHRLATSVDEARAFAGEIGFPLIVKPPAGSGSRNTFRVDDMGQLDECLASLPPSPEQPALVEEFVTGEEHSFDSMMVGGRIVWYSINQYFPTALEVLQHPWVQWCVVTPREVDHPRFEPIRTVAAQALRVLGMQDGLSHLEWFRRKDGSVAVSEVGARPPGAQFTTLASHACGFDLYKAWAQVVVGGGFTPPPRRYAAGICFLRGQGRGRVRMVQGLREAQEEVGELVVEARLPRFGQSPTGTYEGEGFVILRHPETSVVVDGLQRLVRRIRVILG